MTAPGALPTLLAVATAIGCGAAPPPASVPLHQHEALERRLEATEREQAMLTTRVSTLEEKLAAASKEPAPAPPPAQPTAGGPGTWSCAGKCLKSFKCTSSGDSKLDWSERTSTGETAAAVFKSLVTSCTDVVFVQGKCESGRFERVEATIQNACVRN